MQSSTHIAIHAGTCLTLPSKSNFTQSIKRHLLAYVPDVVSRRHPMSYKTLDTVFLYTVFDVNLFFLFIIVWTKHSRLILNTPSPHTFTYFICINQPKSFAIEKANQERRRVTTCTKELVAPVFIDFVRMSSFAMSSRKSGWEARLQPSRIWDSNTLRNIFGCPYLKFSRNEEQSDFHAHEEITAMLFVAPVDACV